MAAAVAEGAACGVAVSAFGTKAVTVVFHQVQIVLAYGGHGSLPYFISQRFINGKYAGTVGAGGKVLHTKLKQGNEKEVEISVGTGDIHHGLPAAQGAYHRNFACRFGAGTDSHNAEKEHCLIPPWNMKASFFPNLRNIFVRIVLCYLIGRICQAYMVVFATNSTI